MTLWAPIQLGACRVKNRVAMAPTVKYTINPDNGYVTDALVNHYRLRAQSGTGLIIVEATSPVPDGKLHPHNLGLWDDTMTEGMSEIVRVIHREGAAAVLQLCHGGVTSLDPDAAHLSASPEEYELNHKKAVSHAMTVSEIHQLETAFRDAAVRAVHAGFDGIELHGTHSKLFSHFLDPRTNLRTDEYGGSDRNRTRFLEETFRLIREAVPDSFIMGVRLGVNLPDFDHAKRIAQIIDTLSPEYLHFSMNFDMPEPSESLPEGFPCNTVVYYGTLLRREVRAPVILSNEITTAEQAAYLLENDLADMVSIGRGMLADYDWTRKAKEGLPISVCLHCRACQWRIDHRQCPRVRSGRGEQL